VHFPLFALDEGNAPVFSHGEINPAIRAPAEGVIDGASLSPIRLGNEVFKVSPGCLAQRFEAGLLVNEAAAFLVMAWHLEFAVQAFADSR